MAIPAILVGGVAGMAISGALAPLFEPITLKLSQTIWPLVPFKQIDPGTLVIARIKGTIDNEHYQSEMAKQGYSGGVNDALIAAAERLIEPGELMRLLIRGLITPDKFTSELARMGTSAESATAIAQRLRRC